MGFRNLVGKFLGKSESDDRVPLSDQPDKKSLRVQFFMQFPNQTEASEVRNWLDGQKFEVFLRLADDFTNWLVVITRYLQPETPEFVEFEKELAGKSEANDGEYLGWEYEIVPGMGLYSTD